MKHGFIKLAAAIPEVSVAAPCTNGNEICEIIDRAYSEGCKVVVFPELCISAYTCGDMFKFEKLTDNSQIALENIKKYTAGKKMLVFVGVPILNMGKLYSCGVAVSDGKILGVVPKSAVTDIDEQRIFCTAPADNCEISLLGDVVPFGAKLLFCCNEMPSLRVACEVGNNPSGNHAGAGALVIAELAASSEIIGAKEYRKLVLDSASAREKAVYVYSNPGSGESTTDVVFSGHSLISCGGRTVAENFPFGEKKLISAVVDLCHLEYDRRKDTALRESTCDGYLRVGFSLDMVETELDGAVAKNPFVPENGAERAAVCKQILDIQAYGLAKRITAAHAKSCVLALSGGLDSTLALLVTVRAFDILKRPRREIITVTMPCFGTTVRTRSNAEALAVEFGTSFRCIDIKEAVDIHFRDIGHDPADLSVVYENAQARERTQIIMDIANACGGLVIGTGDLSELALGWATYNGDHMSNYGVNGGVPKTLIRHIVSCYADSAEAESDIGLAAVLRDILNTPVSPELLPAKDGEISQKTEDIVGPYDLHDFFLYHLVRYGESPEKIFREAKHVFKGEFDEETIKKWLNTFIRRFCSQQFKRSALPDGPKVGSVSLSPRGDLKMPSDANGDEMKLN